MQVLQSQSTFADINSIAQVLVGYRCPHIRGDLASLIRSLSSLPFLCGHQRKIGTPVTPLSNVHKMVFSNSN